MLQALRWLIQYSVWSLLIRTRETRRNKKITHAKEAVKGHAVKAKGFESPLQRPRGLRSTFISLRCTANAVTRATRKETHARIPTRTRATLRRPTIRARRRGVPLRLLRSSVAYDSDWDFPHFCFVGPHTTDRDQVMYEVTANDCDDNGCDLNRSECENEHDHLGSRGSVVEQKLSI